jgi:hypothetical protein
LGLEHYRPAELIKPLTQALGTRDPSTSADIWSSYRKVQVKAFRFIEMFIDTRKEMLRTTVIVPTICRQWT